MLFTMYLTAMISVLYSQLNPILRFCLPQPTICLQIGSLINRLCLKIVRNCEYNKTVISTFQFAPRVGKYRGITIDFLPYSAFTAMLHQPKIKFIEPANHLLSIFRSLHYRSQCLLFLFVVYRFSKICIYWNFFEIIISFIRN